jgi:F420H(2)-dependent quinone reductase
MLRDTERLGGTHEEQRVMVVDPEPVGRPYPRHVARLQGVLTTLHTTAYRLTGGRIGGILMGLPMLLLTTWGRRTRVLRTTPLLYLPINQMLVIVASNGGATRHPTWWFNLRDRPEALVQLELVRGRVRAVPATPAERQHLWPLLVQLYPPYAQYQVRTTREIPLLILHPLDPALRQSIHDWNFDSSTR